MSNKPQDAGRASAEEDPHLANTSCCVLCAEPHILKNKQSLVYCVYLANSFRYGGNPSGNVSSNWQCILQKRLLDQSGDFRQEAHVLCFHGKASLGLQWAHVV